MNCEKAYAGEIRLNALGLDGIASLHMAAGAPVAQVISSTSAVVVGSNSTNTPLQFAVAAARYRVRAHIICTQGAVAARQDFRFLGPAISAMRLDMHSNQDGANPGLGNSTALANDLQTAPFAIGAAFQATIEGWVTFSAASGTLFALQARQDAASQPFTIVDAYMLIQPTS